MISVVVGGATGKLGSLVCRLISEQKDMKLSGAVVSEGSANIGKEISPGVKCVGADKLSDVVKDADVYVDLTSPSAIVKTLPAARRKGLNYVIGTTGIPKEVMETFEKNIAEDGSGAVVTPNFSVGVNVFFKTCESLAAALKEYDIEIIETHHNQKKDAPSGTAKKAAELIALNSGKSEFMYGREGEVGARGSEICIHSVRAGDVVGEHTVIFAGNKERIELTHRAHSREAFAEGAIAAIRWVANKNSGKIHTMYEVLGL